MSPNLLNLLTLLAFLGSLLLGWALLYLRERRYTAPDVRVRQHLQAMLNNVAGTATESNAEIDPDLFQHIQQIKRNSWLQLKLARLRTVCSNHLRHFTLEFALITTVVMAGLVWMMPLNRLWNVLALAASPLATLAIAFMRAESRFKKRFLRLFPDAIDLTVRAVRAGVPPSKAIGLVASEFPAPLNHEFGLIGDALRLGMDMKEVLEEAEARINLPEFSFFCVCLLLQRETGGQLTETLENLATIIRGRQEMAQKATALTGEVRMASTVIACLPFAIVGFLWFIQPSYIGLLFFTPTGVSMLKLAILLILAGLVAIKLMSSLKV